MRRTFLAATSAFALSIAATLPTSPAMADSYRDDQWYLKTMRMQEAHAISRGAGITVAVIDTGSYPHPDLRHNLLKGTSFVRGEKADGRTDRAGHGTEMAALVAGHGRGPNGILGIAPQAKVLPIKITNDPNGVPSTEMAKAIDWSVGEKVSVISISAAIGPSFEVQQATRAALAADVAVVASVGNKSTSVLVGYPAAMDGVLAIGAVGRNGKHASLSLQTPKVMLCTPGVDITTAEPKSGYVDVGGTSPATAIAAGAIALVRAKYPKLSAEDAVHRLTATADDIGPPGRDDECGFGRLNIVKALTADVPPLEGTTPSATTATSPSAPAPTPATTAAAAPDPKPAGSDNTLLLGGLTGLVAAGAVGAFFALRRRRRR